MFSFLRMKRTLLAIGLSGVLMSHAVAASSPLPAMGEIASQQIRHIATYFPGRMAGSPAELIAADYLNQQFNKLGYKSDLRGFDTRYLYTSNDGKKNWQNIHATSVIAARPGDVPQQIIVMAHFDTYVPQSDSDTNHNLGGLTLQGVDDNASGVGVMLELAERMQAIPTHYSLRFVALSAEETGAKGAEDFVNRMSAEEKKNTLLVINLNSLITGDRLYFNSGLNTSAAVAKLTRVRAIKIAHSLGIPAESHDNTHCCDGIGALDEARLPLLNVTATNYALGKKDGEQQRAVSSHFPLGTTRYQSQFDNLQYLDTALPGRIEKRSRDTVKVLFPLLRDLAKPAKHA
ncbi:aminopeptidase [Rahnella sp. BCC 1045]|uniref:aminopeptidase n=1 Tax=Rahnella sp. BCC 1045 TaxID=2816251 RepID=UPI001C26176B|nr:aminopeptidase [Rahnella sp. BCC 1045]MBU9822733.1 aminopeptidase [Rahnella sp. BCC 1045]